VRFALLHMQDQAVRGALLYGSSHGMTRKVVKQFADRSPFKFEIHDVAERPESDLFSSCSLLGFFCPTYGDEELQEDMETFLVGFHLDLTGKYFFICELGNYYGYEAFRFGALHIIRRRLLELNGRELCGPLSLDAFPKVHWGHFDRWADTVNEKVEKHVGR
jgi:flavodoxin